MPKAYFNYASDSACPFHRMLMPARFCAEAFKKHGWEINVGEGLPQGYDLYAFHGLPNETAIFEIAKLKRRGAKFLWSLDDDWLTIPDWNPAKPSEQGLAMYDLAKLQADWILVSTPALAATFDDVKHKVVTAPNLLDLSAFPEVPYTRAEDGRRNYTLAVELPVRVVWSGGVTHKGDVEVVADAVGKVLTKHGPEKVAVVFQGLAPPPELLRKHLHQGLYHQGQVPFPSYQKILNSIRPNVYLAPLAPIDFNLSKSNLRVMEGWALMSAPLATPHGEYNCIRDGVDGRLARTPEDWYYQLNRLVTEHEYRLQLAAEGRGRVEAEYDWNNPKCRRPWYEALATVFGVPTPTV